MLVHYFVWLSRVREYYADEFFTKTTGNPNALASALVNIGFGLNTHEKAKGAIGSVQGASSIGVLIPRTPSL